MDTNSAAYSLGYTLGSLFGHGLPLVGVAVVLGVLVFLVIRWFWLWYWRVNIQVALLTDIVASLRRLEAQGGVAGQAPARP